MNLADLFKLTKQQLFTSPEDTSHPFRTMVLATKGEYPEVRTLIKRKAKKDFSILAYTDYRTHKVKALIAQPKCSLMLYHPGKKLQVELACNGTIIREGELFDWHREKAKASLKDYTTVLPRRTEIPTMDYEIGAEVHFCVLKFEPVHIHSLLLTKERRYRAIYRRDDNWNGNWLVP